MEFIRGLINIKPRQYGCVATIGNFDGVHLGHQELIMHVRQKARDLNLPLTVIIFEPQPNEFFQLNNAPARLMRLREKLAALQKLQVERVVCLRFNQQLALLPAKEFVEQILVEKLGIKHIAVGDDFCFGYQRQGNTLLLQQLTNQYDYTVHQMTTLTIGEERVSSTRIRHALEQTQLKLAETLLGRKFGMSGHVAHGNKLGRSLGYPTANIYLHRRKVPLAGIFAVKIYGLQQKPLYGVANVGTRPTVEQSTRSLLEIYIFDFNQEIYGKHIYVEFIHKFRNEKKYTSLALLKEQIEKDVADARAYFHLDEIP